MKITDFTEFLVRNFRVVSGSSSKATTVSGNTVIIGFPDVTIEEIQQYLPDNSALSKSFYQSWDQVAKTSDSQAFVDKLLHYHSTYGTDFTGTAYMPAREVFETEADDKVYVIAAKSIDEIAEMVMRLLSTNIALKDEEVNILCDIVSLGMRSVVLARIEDVKNRQAKTIISKQFNYVPRKYDEFFRLLMYTMTGDSQPIKNESFLNKLKASDINNIGNMLRQFGLKEIAQHFNRHKPYYLAMKHLAKAEINKISKLSKKHHVPMKLHFLQTAGMRYISQADISTLTDDHIFPVLRVVKWLSRDQTTNNLYRIRNGKAWYCKKDTKTNRMIKFNNMLYLLQWLKGRINLSGKKFYIPDGVAYGIVTSGKQFIGGIPYDTDIKIPDEKLPVLGVYWRNDGGARDIDVSAITQKGAVLSWYSSTLGLNGTFYSGDVTDAPNGAIEFIRFCKGFKGYLVSNIFRYTNEKKDVTANLVIGFVDNSGQMDKRYMLNPKEREVDVQIIMKENARNNISAIVMPNAIRIGQYNIGQSMLANTEGSDIIYNALTQNMLSFNDLVLHLGGEIVNTPDGADYDFSLHNVTKEMFINLLTPES